MTPLIVVSGPSGAGKSTLCRAMLGKFPQLVSSVSYTTRQMRENEKEGETYYFVTEEKFFSLIEKDFFIEWEKVHNQHYGTPKDLIEKTWKNEGWIIMDVNVQGAKTLKKLYPTSTSVFISGPSIDELRRRIMEDTDRGPMPDLELRMKNAERELEEVELFDWHIVNDDFERTVAEFEKIINDILKS